MINLPKYIQFISWDFSGKIPKSFKPEPSCPNELSNSESDEEVLYSPKVFGTCALNCSYSLFIQDQSKIDL